MWSPYLVCSYTLAEAIAVTNKREECRGLYIAFVDSTLTLGQLSTALPSGWLLETLFDGNIGHMFAATGFICGGVTTACMCWDLWSQQLPEPNQVLGPAHSIVPLDIPDIATDASNVSVELGEMSDGVGGVFSPIHTN
mmetsp:Transcript_35012/g.75755  ORF Transcript_35012/g.75755 Transcript_35012/m.75755 type:complete len:138 (+) Transcript_35012:639-1052(+)